MTASARAHLRLVDQPAESPEGSGEASRAWVREVDDATLVAMARENRLSAFEHLYRRHVGFALNLAARVQGNRQDIEDIVQDAFVRAHESLVELRDAQRFRLWLGAIVIRLVRSRLRRQRLLSVLGMRAAEPLDIEAVAASEASPEARAQLAQLYALLNTLNTEDRIAWTLRYIDQHRLEAVAELTDCSLATAKRRILRVQRYLDQHFVTPFPEAAADASA